MMALSYKVKISLYDRLYINFYHFDAAARNKMALISILVAAAVLLFFVVAGELILTATSNTLAGIKLYFGL